MSDIINSLPTDETPLGYEEEQILDQLLKSDENMFHKFASEMKYPLMYSALFLVMSTPAVDGFLSLMPYAKSDRTSLVIVKTILFLIGIFIINNVPLVFS